MNSSLDLFFSHQVESLYQKLRQRLLASYCSLFAKRVIIVPSPALKNWLQLMLASDPEIGIAFGIDIVYLDQAINKMLKPDNGSGKRLPDIFELAFLIESTLKIAFCENAEWIFPLKHLLDTSFNIEKFSRRLTTFSLKIACLFEKYSVYGGNDFEKWMASATNWQKILWQKVWLRADCLTTPCQLMAEMATENSNLLVKAKSEIHVFALSFLPALYHRFLSEVSTFVPVHYYVLSPCQAFWSDIKSDREKRSIYLYWKARGASQVQLNQLEMFLADRNPLLANFGRLGREMAQLVEVADHHVEEAYFLPEAIAEFSCYHELITPSVTLQNVGEATILKLVQADLTLLRNPLGAEKIECAEEDQSIQLHICATKRREVENLYNVLLGIFKRHAEDDRPITPRDIVVMAPDLMDYAPYIHVIFGDPNSRLDYQMMEVKLLSQSLFVQDFLKLLELAHSRWDAATVIAVLELPSLQCRHFKKEDIYLFRQWINASNIRWGEDDEHCNEILKREMCSSQLVDNHQPGTWKKGLARLLDGLALASFDVADLHEHAPLEIDTSNAELLGNWIAFFKSLRADLKPLCDGTVLTVEGWVHYFQSIIEAYLFVDPNNKEEVENHLQFEAELKRLVSCSQFTAQHTLTFSGMKIYLERAFNSKRVNYREGHLQAIRFCSLLPMRALPAQVIVMLGLNEETFPGQRQDSDLDLLKERQETDYFPLPGDFDRSLFLESMISARAYFILSYTAFSEGAEKPPSILVSELMTYLDTCYDFSQKKPSETLIHRHCLLGFEAAYFSDDSLFPSYCDQTFAAAKAYYFGEKKPKHAFIPSFLEKECKVAKEYDANCSSASLRINVKELVRLAKNPLQLYFNKILGIYIHPSSKRILEADEKFTLNHLDFFLLKEKSLHHSIEKVVYQSFKEGALPAGVFKEVALKNLQNEVKTIVAHMQELDIHTDDIFDIVLADHCEQVNQKGKKWICPPLRWKAAGGEEFTIVGKLSLISSKGVLAFKKKNFDHAVQMWPQMMILHALIDQHRLPIQQALIFLQDGQRVDFAHLDMGQLFSQFLTYYQQAVRSISPLIPEWISATMSADIERLNKTMLLNFDAANELFYNLYAKWSFDSLPCAEEIVRQWQSIAINIYGPLKDLCQAKDKQK